MGVGREQEPHGPKTHAPDPAYESQPIVIGETLPGITVADSPGTLQMLVPLCGADLRQVYVLAGPHSIVVEIRTRKAINHAHVVITEVQDERITREFRLNTEIREGATALRRVGDELEITCMKADGAEDRIWSELVRFNTRASLGSI